MKTNLFVITLILALTNYFLPKEINLVVMCGVLFFLAPYDRTISYKSSYAVIWPLIVLALIGFSSGLNNIDNVNRDFYRDLFSFSRIIVYFFFGILLSKYIKDLATFYKCFALFVLLSSVQHLALVLVAIRSFHSFDQYRKATGMTNFDEAILLSIYISSLFNRTLRRLLQKLPLFYKGVTFIILISFLSYFSRTMIVTLVILIFFLTDTLNLRKISYPKNRRIFAAALIMPILFFSISFFASANPSNMLLKTFVEKFERSSEEIFWNEEENSTATIRDIQDNWRGYEAYQGIMKFDEGNNTQQFFGYGYGALVDLGVYMKLNRVEYDKVPILHNGYVFLLIKCGIVGLVFYLLFLYLIGFFKIKNYVYEIPELYYYYQMLSGLSFLTLINTFTVTGLFNPGSATVPILFGFFWGCAQRRKKEILSEEPEVEMETAVLNA